MSEIQTVGALSELVSPGASPVLEVEAAACAAPPWAVTAQESFTRARSGAAGLDPAEADRRLRASRQRATASARSVSLGRVVLAQLQSPLLLLLVFAAAVSAITREWIDAGLVLAIVLVSVGIGAFREYKGQAAAAALAARIRMRASVVRAGVVQRVPADEVVVGDIIALAAGSLVPADAVVLEASDCQVNEAVRHPNFSLSAVVARALRAVGREPHAPRR